MNQNKDINNYWERNLGEYYIKDPEGLNRTEPFVYQFYDEFHVLAPKRMDKKYINAATDTIVYQIVAKCLQKSHADAILLILDKTE